jgi:hypothetical protein
MEGCKPYCIATKLLVAGIVLILVTLFTTWNIWIVIGAMLIIKAIIMFIAPNCCCHKKEEEKKKK